MGAGQRRLFRSADDADHRRAEMLCPLAEDGADPTGGGVDQNGLARLDRKYVAQQILGSQALGDHRRRGDIVDPVRQPHQMLGGQHPRLGIGATRQRMPASRIGGPVADLELGHARPDGLHHAHRLAADGMRQMGKGIASLARMDIGKIDPDGALAQQHFAGTGLGNRYVLNAENFGAAIGVNANGFGHFLFP